MTPDELKNPTIQRALLLGTYDKPDRSKQYQAPHEEQPSRLLRAVNTLGDHTRHLQSNQAELQRQLMNFKLRNGVVIAVITGLLARAPEIWSWLMRITQ